MPIAFLKDWRIYHPGDTSDAIEPGVADVLFRRGIARSVPTVQTVTPLIEVTIIPPVVAVITPPVEVEAVAVDVSTTPILVQPEPDATKISLRKKPK